MRERTAGLRAGRRRRAIGRLQAEDGSLVLALLATIVVGGLVTVVVATVLSGHRSARFDEEFTGALHVAEAGVQQAVHRLNAGQEIEDGAGTVDGRPFEWEATQLDDTEWEVLSRSLDGTRVDRTLRAVITDQPLFDLAAFSENVLDFQGTNQADSYHSGEGEWCTGRGRVGSNGELDFSGTASGQCTVYDEDGNEISQASVDGVDLYDWQGGNAYDDRCVHAGGTPNNCWVDSHGGQRRFVTHEDPVTFDTQLAWVEELLEDCADNYALPDLEAGDDFGLTIPPAGPTDGPEVSVIGDDVHAYCANSVTFDGHTSLSGASLDDPVVFLVADHVSVTGNQRRVNCDGCGSGGNWDPADQPVYPVAGALQIYTNSDENSSDPSDDVIDIGNHARFAASVFAPRGTCGGSAGAHVFGSMICWDIVNVGNWKFHYDEALGESVTTGQYAVAQWAEE